MLMQAPVATVVFRGPDHVIELANDLYLAIVVRSREELLHKLVAEAMLGVLGRGFV